MKLEEIFAKMQIYKQSSPTQFPSVTIVQNDRLRHRRIAVRQKWSIRDILPLSHPYTSPHNYTGPVASMGAVHLHFISAAGSRRGYLHFPRVSRLPIARERSDTANKGRKEAARRTDRETRGTARKGGRRRKVWVERGSSPCNVPI